MTDYHFLVEVDVELIADTAGAEILLGYETQKRCGCTHELELDFGHEITNPPPLVDP